MAYFNYRNLDPTEFEALAKDVMERLLDCRLFRYGQGKDGGIDLCDDIREKHIVVQCKKYQQGAFDNLYNVLKGDEKPKIDKLNPRLEQYYVFTSIELLPLQKKKILNLFQEYMEGESCIVDGIAINDFFRDEQNHDLIPRNIKLFISLPENYRYGAADLLQIEANRLYDRLFSIFENDRKNHPSIRMMDPDPSLFPKGLPEIFSDGRHAVEDVEEKEEPRAIREMILDSWKRKDRKHIMLIGKGGIGKTVAMLTLPVEDWFKKFGIPVIYIPLQRLDAFHGDLNRYIREKIGYDNYDCCIEQANSIPEGHPRLLLLLDGFNEIPDKYKKAVEKCIREWMEKPGIQLITTSRMRYFQENCFLKYQLQPLPHVTVKSFLLSAGIVEEQLPEQNDRIWKVINIPLMLTIYTQIEKVREAADQFSEVPIFEWKQSENAACIIWNYLQMEIYRCIIKDDPSHSAPQYATAILAIAPYICCRMSNLNKFYIKREEFLELIQDALDFYTVNRSFLDKQIRNIRDEFAPYDQDDLFRKENTLEYVRILIDNIGLFQTQKIRRTRYKNDLIIDYTCSLMHQNFRDALAAFYICSCLSKADGVEEKKALLNQADHYVKDYMAEILSDRELISIWDKHRKEEPDDGQITFILMDIIGRQRNYDYQELDFSGVDLTKTNLHRLLSKRLDICPLPRDRSKLKDTNISIECLSPNGHTGWVVSVAYSPDGRQVASGATDRTVRIWDLASGESRVLEGHAGGVMSVAYSPDGRQVASGATDRTVRIWNLASGESHVLEGHSGRVSSIAFSPDGRQLASGATDRTVRVWNLVDWESHILEGHVSGVSSIAFSLDGKLLASGAYDWTIRVWDLVGGESSVLEGHAGWITSVAFSPDGRQVASGATDRTVRLWDLASGESRVLEGHSSRVSSIAFSPDGRQLASGSADRTVRLWDLVSWESHVLESHAGCIRSVVFSPDGRQLAIGSEDSTVRIWDLASGESRVHGGHAGEVRSVAFSADSRQLAIGADDSTVRLWDLESGESRVLEGHADWVKNVAFSADGRQLASVAADSTLRIWNLISGESRVIEGPAGLVSNVIFSADGRQLAVEDDRTVRVWNLVSGESHVLESTNGWVRSIAFSADGGQLAIVSDDRTVRIWNLVSGESRVLEGHAGGDIRVAFSPDGRQLASCTSDGLVLIWDLESGESRVLEGPISSFSNVTFIPNRSWLISNAISGTVRGWDLTSGEHRMLKGPAGLVSCVAFSADGRQLARVAFDNMVRIWDVEQCQEIGKYAIITHINLSGANFELAIIDQKDKEILKAAGAKVKNA